MTVDTKSSLLTRSNQVRTEVGAFANSSSRIGGLFRDIVDTVFLVPSGLDPDATGAVNTAAIQAAIDAANTAYLAGKGVMTVELPSGTFTLAASTVSATLYNYGPGAGGESFPASSGCLLLRPGVRLVGAGIGRTVLRPATPSLDCLYIVDGSNAAIEGIEINGGWTSSGTGHGILHVTSTSVLNVACENLLIQDVYVHDVGSYGFGPQNGVYTDMTVRRFRTKNTGADGIDIKARPWPSNDSKGITLENIYIENPGLRLDGQTGVDLRGIVHATNVTVVGVGRAAVQMSGIRMRTAGADEGWGDRCVVEGFYVKGSTAFTSLGVDIGGSDCSLLGGVVESCQEGVTIGGNATEPADKNYVAGVVVRGAIVRGFHVYSGNNRNKLAGCTAESCLLGYSNDGAYTVFVGNTQEACTTVKSASVSATQTEVISGNAWTNDFAVLTSSAAGRCNLEARGASANIDVHIEPKGTGVLRVGTHTASADAPVSGYITIRDTSGTVRKLAVIT